MEKSFERKLRSVLNCRYQNVVNAFNADFDSVDHIDQKTCYYKIYKPAYSRTEFVRSLHIYVDQDRGVSGNFLTWLDDLNDSSVKCSLINICSNGKFLDLYYQIIF